MPYLAQIMEEIIMKTKKKSRFLSFCFSFLPGAAEMYMGFMKTGISLMLAFFLLIAVGGWMQQTIITLFDVVVWAYGFFHANHLAGLSDEEFAQVEDEYIFGMDSVLGTKEYVEKYQKWIAYGLIFIGACFLWNTMANLLHSILPEQYTFISRMMWRIGSYVPSIVIGAGIIFLGVRLLNGKKVEVVPQEEKEEKILKENVIEESSKADGQEEK